MSPIGNHAEVVQMWEAFLSHLEGQSVPDLTMDGFRQWVVSSERGLAILGRFLNFFLTGPKDKNSSFIAKSLDLRKQYATTWPTSVAYKEKRSALLREDYWEWLAKGEQGICSINDAFIDDIAARRQECGKILSGIYRTVLLMELSSDFIREAIIYQAECARIRNNSLENDMPGFGGKLGCAVVLGVCGLICLAQAQFAGAGLALIVFALMFGGVAWVSSGKREIIKEKIAEGDREIGGLLTEAEACAVPEKLIVVYRKMKQCPRRLRDG